MAMLTAPVNAINAAPISCNWCGEVGHTMEQCVANPESVHYVSNFNRSQNNPYSNTYNPGWRNHPNFAWNNQGAQQQARPTLPPGFQQQQRPNQQLQQPEKKTSLEDMFLQFMQSQAAAMRSLEHQMGQIASSVGARQPGNLPGNTEANPKGSNNEQCNAIMLRSGRELSVSTPHAAERTDVSNSEFAAGGAEQVKPTKEQGEPRMEKKKEAAQSKPLPPYPQRLQKAKEEQNFKKFMEMLKQLHINIPLVEALEQMPKYMKFMKEILSKKRHRLDNEVVALTEECSAVMKNKLPPKLADPGSFTIPCAIGSLHFGKVLCDLGASINLMPMSIFRKLGIEKLKSTNITLQLADRTITYPEGILENVLVKVDKFIFPADFFVMDYEADAHVPIILGRPFLATAGAEINVKQGVLTLNVEEEKVEFEVLQGQKKKGEIGDCMCEKIDAQECSEDLTGAQHMDAEEKECLAEDMKLSATWEATQAC